MKLSEFLILLLQTQAQSLLRLAAFFGEDVLVEILEATGDEQKTPQADRDWLVGGGGSSEPRPLGRTARTGASPYRALEGAVQELSLPAILEFHLWAYPFYRCLIEAGFDLEAPLKLPSGSPPYSPLIEEAVAQSDAWVRALPIPPELAVRAEQASKTPWVRFRSEALRRMGLRPIGVVPT